MCITKTCPPILLALCYTILPTQQFSFIFFVFGTIGFNPHLPNRLPQPYHWTSPFLAHLSRRLIWRACRIGRPLSSIVRHRRPHSLNISSETTGSIKVKFHMALLWDVGTKVCSNGPGHMIKVVAMPIYGKNLKKNLLLRNQKADLDSWYASSGAWVLPSLLKWWVWVDLLRQGQIWSLMLLYGKKVKQLIFQKLLSSMIWN